MKIYTKTGDAGDTGLLGGDRVAKDDLVVNVCGTLDEANCLVGLVRCSQLPEAIENELEMIQRDLFCIGASVAGCRARLADPVQLGNGRIGQLEQAIDELDRQLPQLTAFILPGGSRPGAQIHLCRAVVRRAERELVALIHSKSLADALKDELVYLNRLSDLLFVMARFVNQSQGIVETSWTAD